MSARAYGRAKGPTFSPDQAFHLALARADPQSWMRAHLGSSLSPNGVQIAEAVRDHPRVAVKAAHSISKSFTSARIVVWFMHAYPGAVVLTTAPTFNQVENILWREIRSIYDDALQPLVGKIMANVRIEVASRWYALGFKSSDSKPNRFQGFHAPYILIVVDEANGVDRRVIEPLVSTLSSGQVTRLLLIGNPVEPQGEFFEAFTTKAQLYKRITVSAFDTPNFTLAGLRTIADVMAATPAQLRRAVRFPYLTTPTWVREVIEEHGPDSQYVLSRVLAQFPTSTPDALISLGWVERARSRDPDQMPDNSGQPVEAGLDIADDGLGSDETVLTIRQGWQILAEYPWVGLDPIRSAQRAIEYLAPYRDKLRAVRVDVIGIGKGTFSYLQQAGLPVVALDVRATPTSDDYPNRRAELWWNLRNRFAQGTIEASVLSERTVGQLTAMKAKNRVGYRFADVETKDDLRRRGLRSPDRAEALIFAFAGGLGNASGAAITTDGTLGQALLDQAQKRAAF